MDIKTERRHYLNVPMVTRYIRIHPLTWRKRIGLRVGVLGCPHEGECGPGFLSVNERSGCGKQFFINHISEHQNLEPGTPPQKILDIIGSSFGNCIIVAAG